jgi:hypothetical protein
MQKGLFSIENTVKKKNWIYLMWATKSMQIVDDNDYRVQEHKITCFSSLFILNFWRNYKENTKKYKEMQFWIWCWNALKDVNIE